MISNTSKECRRSELFPLGGMMIDREKIVAIAPNCRGSSIYFNDGSIYHARLSPQNVYGKLFCQQGR